MNTGQMPGLGQFGQVSADGLLRDAEILGQRFDADPALAAGDIEDAGLAQRGCHAATMHQIAHLATFIRVRTNIGEHFYVGNR